MYILTCIGKDSLMQDNYLFEMEYLAYRYAALDIKNFILSCKSDKDSFKRAKEEFLELFEVNELGEAIQFWIDDIPEDEDARGGYELYWIVSDERYPMDDKVID